MKKIIISLGLVVILIVMVLINGCVSSQKEVGSYSINFCPSEKGLTKVTNCYVKVIKDGQESYGQSDKANDICRDNCAKICAPLNMKYFNSGVWGFNPCPEGCGCICECI